MDNDPLTSAVTDTSSQPRASSYHSEELFRLVIENVEDFAIFTVDLEGNLASWNPGVEKLLGYTEDEFVGRDACDIFTPEDNEQDMCGHELRRAEQSGRAEDQRWHLRKDGTRFWANGLMMSLRDDAGSLRGFAKIMRDDTAHKRMEDKTESRVEERTRELSAAISVLEAEVSERERAEAALHKEREFLSALLESIEDGIVACDAEGRLTLFNRATREFHGLPDEPLPPEEWTAHYDLYEADGVTPLERERIPLFRAWHDGQVRDAEMVIAPKEGEARTLLASGRALFDAENRKIGAVVSMHDVTAQRRAVEERIALAREQARRLEAETANRVKDELINQIKVAEERYRSFVTATSTALWSADAHGNIVAVPDWNALTGQSADSFQGWEWLEALHPEDREPTKHLWTEAITNRSPYYAEFRTLSPDGSYRHHAARAVPILNADGTVREWIGAGTDIEDVKRAEEALKESEERFRLFAQTATDAIIAIDTESRILFANKAAEDIFGYRIADMEGTSLTMLMPDYLRRLHSAGTNRYLRTGQRHVSWESVEVPGLHKDGREIPLDISFGEYNRGGKRYFTGICRDISERKRAQLRLDAQYSVTRILAESDTVSEATPRIIQTVCESLSWDVGGLWRVHPDENHLRCAESWHAPSLTDEVYADMCSQHPLHAGVGLPGRVWSSGEALWISDVTLEENFPRERAAERAGLRSAFAFPIRLGGEIVGVMEFFSREVRERDENVIEMISTLGSQIGQFIERRHVEKERTELLTREREARTAAEEANRLKDEFLATLSHELRTPLTSILGWARLLRSGNLTPDAAERALEVIERNARSQNALIGDILDVSRIITGKLRLEVRPVELSPIIEAAADAVRPAADAKNVRLQVLLDPSAGQVSGDSDRLQQVVWNLLTNAVKFTSKGGRVQVRLECINSHVEIVISDTGQGIPPEFLPYVFDRFRQADQNSTRTHGGLGLGLSIVKQFVEMHGGTVGVDSAGEGQGTTFTVALPRLAVRREQQTTQRVHPTADTATLAALPLDCPPSLEGLHVLVVDDEADTRDLLRAILERCGSRVSTAASAAEALTLLETSKPDVLLSDIGMPNEDGYTLIREVRAREALEKLNHIPAIALTAYARVEDRVRALKAGFQVHVPKPIEPVELTAVVASLVGRYEVE